MRVRGLLQHQTQVSRSKLPVLKLHRPCQHQAISPYDHPLPIPLALYGDTLGSVSSNGMGEREFGVKLHGKREKS